MLAGRMVERYTGGLIIMVWAIRGATTVSDNTADEIVAETQNCLKKWPKKTDLRKMT